MSRQFWQETLAWSTANGTQISNSTAEALVFPNVTIPANYMQDGRTLEMIAMGKFSNVVTTPGTLIFRLRWGGLTGTILAQTSAISLSATAQTDIMFRLWLEVITRVNGASGSLLAMGQVELAAQLAASNNQPNMMGSAGGASTNTPAAVTVDLTADTALSLTAQFSVATSPTNLTGMNYLIKSLN
jgi:hypothetical protein